MGTDSSQDQLLMVLAPFKSWFEADEVVPGSTTYRADCGHLSWISPQGQAFIDGHPDTPTTCLSCHPVELDEVGTSYSVPGARKALDDLLGSGEHADAYRAFVARHKLKEWDQ